MIFSDNLSPTPPSQNFATNGLFLSNRWKYACFRNQHATFHKDLIILSWYVMAVFPSVSLFEEPVR